MHSKWNQDYSPLAKRLVLVAFLLCVTTGLKASPLYYSYEGVITGFNITPNISTGVRMNLTGRGTPSILKILLIPVSFLALIAYFIAP